MKKLLTILLSIAIVFSLVACNEGASEEKTAMDILLAATEKAAEWKNYDMEISSYMKMNDPAQGEIEMETTGIGTVFIDPMKLHMTMDMKITGVEETQQIEQYMIQEGDAILLYQHLGDQWVKAKMEVAGLGDLLQSNPSEDIQLMMDYTKSAEIVGEEEIDGQMADVIDLVISMEIYTEMMKENEELGALMNLEEDVDLSELFSEMDDLQYKMWVDQASGEIVKYDMDLGEMMQTLMSKMQSEDIPEEEMAIFEGIEMTMTMMISNQNAAEDFELPQEALDAADMGDMFQ